MELPEKNVTDTVEDILCTSEPDSIVIQSGSIEITNIDMKKAYMDTEKNIDDYKNEWNEMVEEDSKNLFEVAFKAAKRYPNMKVVIVKRLPRFDSKSSDPEGIKSQLTKFANHVYDQLWYKKGCVPNIHIVEIDLNISGQGYLKDIIFGVENAKNYDGIHLRGNGASRHFSYRAVQAIGPVINYHLTCPQTQFQKYHLTCPQTQFQNRQLRNGGSIENNRVTKRSIGRQEKYQHRYSVETSNIFENLN